ncbi:MAG: sulfite exporter TauE/SafE family protein [Gemmatimonadetes bacterium]|nr:sulfite exporter TauE/SafE family protein [Gemmatimonadota bacterium]
MIALLASVFTASLLGSLHCAAMCGGFVCAVSGEGRPLASQIAWHAGRGVAYLLLGVLAGLLGAGLEHTLAPAGLPHAAAAGAGALLIVAGVGALVQALGWRGTPTPDASPFARVIGSGLRAVRGWPLLARATAMGSLTALLPCGWLWAFVATAAGTGSALGGLAVMAVFWSGTLPLLAALGFAAGRVLGPLRARLPVITALAMIVVGLLTVAGRLQPHTMDHSMHGGHAGHSMHMRPAAHTGATHVGH